MERLDLGQFIDALAAIDAEKSIRFDFAKFTPRKFISWRGAYEQLALTYDEYSPVKVGELLAAAREADGARFEGYKGGSYLMSRESKLWVSAYGDADWTGITGVSEGGYSAIINTAWFEDDL